MPNSRGSTHFRISKCRWKKVLPCFPCLEHQNRGYAWLRTPPHFNMGRTSRRKINSLPNLFKGLVLCACSNLFKSFFPCSMVEFLKGAGRLDPLCGPGMVKQCHVKCACWCQLVCKQIVSTPQCAHSGSASVLATFLTHMAQGHPFQKGSRGIGWFSRTMLPAIQLRERHTIPVESICHRDITVANFHISILRVKIWLKP